MSATEATAPPRPRGKKKPNRLPAVFVVAALAGVGWWGYTKSQPKDTNNKLLTAVVSRGDLVESINATGSVTAQTGAQVKIGSQITGRIKRLYADVGSFVRQNQVIAELDLPDIEAQVMQAQAGLAAAKTRLSSAEYNLVLQKSQTATGIQTAQSQINGANARLRSVRASANLQVAQTPETIRRAEAEVARVKATISTAQSALRQTEASAKLQIATAQEQLAQARANSQISDLTLGRNKELIGKGFVAQSVVDTAVADSTVKKSQVTTAQQNVNLMRERTAADIQAARDTVTQAQRTQDSVASSLVSARAGTLQNTSRLADVNDAEASLATARTALQTAQANKSLISVREQEVEQARENIRIAEAQLAGAKAQMDKTSIRSPITGTVLQLASQQGETLAAGLSAPTLIIVADLKRLQVDVFVDETDIGKVKLGQVASVSVDAFPKRKLTGKVTKIASGSTIQQGVITYDVTVSLDKLEEARLPIKPDMTASVTIQTNKYENVLLVPAEGVKVGTKGAIVNILGVKDDKPAPVPRPVKTGASDGANTEIKEGLKEGEEIVLAGGDDGKKRGGAPNPFGGDSKKGGGKKQ